MSKTKPRGTPPHGADERGRKYVPQFALAIVCKDEPDQQRLYRRPRRLGFEPKVLAI